MSETTAQQKFACPSCGGEATWNPAKQALVCAYCGTQAQTPLSDSPTTPGQIIEHDLVAALRANPKSARGWKTDKRSVRCQSCQAISVFDPTRVGQRCDFCGSSALVPYEEIQESIRPESLLPIRLSETQVREKIRTWYGSHWFAPNALGAKAMTDQLKGVYIPYWTFDAHVHADWTAQSGYHYYETETVRDAQGNTRTVSVQKTRWQFSSGSVDHFFDDELVCASKGVHPKLIPRFDWRTTELVPFDVKFLAGWVVERYQVDLVTAAKQSRKIMDEKLQDLCASEVPGDTHRNLSIDAHWHGQTFKHILVPVWLLTYTYHGKTYQVLVDGFSGRIEGEYPKSFWKIFFLIVGILLLFGLFLLFAQSR